MCFSAQASFIASGGLAVAGGAALKIATKRQRVLASIPFLFSIQQAFEGIQWLSLGRGEISLFAAYTFLFFGFIVWPIYVPLALYRLERGSRRIMRWFVIMGAITSLLYLIGFLSDPLHVQVVGRSIDYGYTVPLPLFANILYGVTVFGALLMSHKRLLQFLDVAVLAAAIAAQLFFYATFASVWCFFAAITSVLIYVYIRYARHHKNA